MNELSHIDDLCDALLKLLQSIAGDMETLEQQVEDERARRQSLIAGIRRVLDDADE